MGNENTFSYTYSAKENQEVLDIRKKYMPQEESKLEELIRLDNLVQSSGVTEGLCTGVGGILLFGLGMCLAMGMIGQMRWLGIVLSAAGIAGMLTAFSVYRKYFAKAKDQHIQRILELTEELSGNL